jgi:hypothetical protein
MGIAVSSRPFLPRWPGLRDDKASLSHAYPFVSFSFVLVVLRRLSSFHEPLTWPKLVGMSVVVGIVIGSLRVDYLWLFTH